MPSEQVRLATGPWSADVHDGQLSDVRWKDRTLALGILVQVRDSQWREVPFELVQCRTSTSRVSAVLSFAVDDRNLSIKLTTSAVSDRLTVSAQIEAEEEVSVNRAGLIILFDPSIFEGRPFRTDKHNKEEVFPILPTEPTIVSGLRHLSVTAAEFTADITIDGDAGEIEDHRVWTEAQIKLFMPPLTKAFPYTIGPQSSVHQTVSLRINSHTKRRSKTRKEIELRPLELEETIPELIAGDDPRRENYFAESALRAMREVGFDHVATVIDMRRDAWKSDVSNALRMVEDTAARLTVRTILPDGCSAESSLRELRSQLGQTIPAGIMPVPEPYLQSLRMKSQLPEPPLGVALSAARSVFGDVPLIGGVFGHYPEIRRLLPEMHDVNAICHFVAANMHSGRRPDIVASLNYQSSVFQAVREILPIGVRYTLGLMSIGTAYTPQSRAGPTRNPALAEIPGTDADPRNTTCFGAAFAVASLANTLGQDIESVGFSELCGPLGVLTPATTRADKAALTPLGAVLRDLARQRGKSRLALDAPAMQPIWAVGTRSGTKADVWIGSMFEHPITISMRDCRVTAVQRLAECCEWLACPEDTTLTLPAACVKRVSIEF